MAIGGLEEEEWRERDAHLADQVSRRFYRLATQGRSRESNATRIYRILEVCVNAVFEDLRTAAKPPRDTNPRKACLHRSAKHEKVDNLLAAIESGGQGKATYHTNVSG